MTRLNIILKEVFLTILILLSFSMRADIYAQEIKTGDVLPLWKEGYLDIHHINTGKGESTFFILPDGTTMLVDAGVTSLKKPRATDPKPNDSRTPGAWIARYILHFMQGFPEKKLDYMIASHFHEDHIGLVAPDIQTSRTGAFQLSGLTEVGEWIPCATFIDRGWPDYQYPVPPESESTGNYIQFVKWKVANEKSRAERFRVGANDQIRLTKNPQKYPHFEIRNIAANGHVWTGVGTIERNYFPAMKDVKENSPNENACSIAFRISYGKFDYFTGGDLYSVTSEPWMDIETPVGRVTGPVEACKANHHANFDTMGKLFLEALRPQVVIIQNWCAQQPDFAVLRRMQSTKTYPGSRDVFTTNMMEETRIVAGTAVDKLKGAQGHVVIRVNPGGADYHVYILDDTEENFKVKAIYGPYICN